MPQFLGETWGSVSLSYVSCYRYYHPGLVGDRNRYQLRQLHIIMTSKRVDVYPPASNNNININKLTMYTIHHMKHDTGRLNIERKEGGGILLQI